MESPLFEGIKETEFSTLISCLAAKVRKYEKNEYVFRNGEHVDSIGLVLIGSVRVMHEDFWGKTMILAHIEKGGVFGEAFSCADVEKLPVSVVAAEPLEVMLINIKRIVNTCGAACSFHTVLIKNMINLLARKNIMLTEKIQHITRRNTREKLLSYLSSQSKSANSHSFSIPFSRQELADYLSVERSAMSSELSKMRNEGILSFDRNRFELLRKEEDFY